MLIYKLLAQVIQVSKLSGAVADLAISGLPGWITIMSPGIHGGIRFRVWVPVGVEVFVRPPMPVPVSTQPTSERDDPLW